MAHRLLALAAAPLLTGCSVWFFSGETAYDRSRPVALIETIGGVELGATTEFGVLTLGRTAETGPCRVHYFLGPTPITEDGTLVATASVFTRAEIDLKTMAVRALDRPLTATDELLVMWTADGTSATTVTTRLAQGDDIAGDLLRDPGRRLPAGASVLLDTEDDGLLFVGLIAGRSTFAGSSYYHFAGLDRLREMLAIPEPYPTDLVPKYRADDISVMKPRVTPKAPAPAPTFEPPPK